MKRLRSKMTTEELADSLGVARQTVNRWIRQQGWKTEGINGVKGGRARLIHIDARVREHIMNLRPSVTVRLSINWQKRQIGMGCQTSGVLRQIIDSLENMTPIEQERLAIYWREGIQGFLPVSGLLNQHKKRQVTLPFF
jgi:IS30 family transposase